VKHPEISNGISMISLDFLGSDRNNSSRLTPHAVAQATPIIPTRPPRFLETSEVFYTIRTPFFASSLSRRGLRRGWGLSLNAVFSGLIPEERRSCVLGLSGKGNAETGFI